MTTKSAITDLLELSILAETTKSMKVRQITKMKGGKVNRILKDRNDESKRWKSGVKLEN